MKYFAVIVLTIILVFLGIHVYSLFVEQRSLGQDLNDIETRLAGVKNDEADLQSDVQYLANPVNLGKELRSRFNYKKPGETMIVIVPTGSSTASTTNGDNE
jgi:hypothetical protein